MPNKVASLVPKTPLLVGKGKGGNGKGGNGKGGKGGEKKPCVDDLENPTEYKDKVCPGEDNAELVCPGQNNAELECPPDFLGNTWNMKISI